MPKKLMFEGLPVREGKRPVRISPTTADKKRAKKGDPACCVAAECLKRTHALDDVRVYRSRVLMRPSGKQHWVRLAAPNSLSEEIRIFDRTGEFSGKSFLCKPLQPSQTSAGYAKSNKKHADRTSEGKVGTRRHASPMTKLRGSPHFKRVAA